MEEPNPQRHESFLSFLLSKYSIQLCMPYLQCLTNPPPFLSLSIGFYFHFQIQIHLLRTHTHTSPANPQPARGRGTQHVLHLVANEDKYSRRKGGGGGAGGDLSNVVLSLVGLRMHECYSSIFSFVLEGVRGGGGLVHI